LEGTAVTTTPEKLQSSATWRRTQEEFLATGSAAGVLSTLTTATDEIVRMAYTGSIAPALPQAATMLAAGAYGRSQTYPYSGADVIVLVDSNPDSDAMRLAKSAFTRVLWDSGLRLNYTVRTLAECLDIREGNLDLAIGLLDRRFLAGDQALHARLEERLPAAITRNVRRIEQRLLQSARARHARFGNTSHHLEPDVKEGPGGLRDLRLIAWVETLHPQGEPVVKRLQPAADMVAAARCFLHYRAGRDENTFDIAAQENLAAPPFKLVMRDYFRQARQVYQEARWALERLDKTSGSLLDNFRDYRTLLSNSDFSVIRERLLLRNPARLESEPDLAIRMLEFIAQHGVPLAPDTERRLADMRREVRPLWPALTSILWAPHTGAALRAASHTGLLTAMFPEWVDLEHTPLPAAGRRYTADEHALAAVECVSGLRAPGAGAQGQFAQVLAEIDRPAVLVFATLFSDAGSVRAKAAMERIQMPAEDQATVEFLIAHQDELVTAMNANLADSAVIRDFADRIGTVEQLRQVAILTFASRLAGCSENAAVEPHDRIWQTYSLLREELTRELETARIEQAPGDLPVPPDFVRGFPTRYLRAHTPGEIAAHYRLYEQSRPTGAAVQLAASGGFHRLTVIARDRPYLFASFTSAISSFGLDIVSAEAFSNGKGVILDTFVCSDPKRLLQKSAAEGERLTDLMQRVALGKTDTRLLRHPPPPDSKKRAIAPQVRFDSASCETATLVEIVTEDRPGLLYSLATVFSSAACNIDVVLVDTKGRRAMDVFYIAYEGRKLSAELESRLREKLLAAC
jgi:[protein-PII] uridylyltransferase